MSNAKQEGSTWKRKATREFQDYLGISLYLTVFFCAIVAYTHSLVKEPGASYLSYSFAVINALVIGKVIVIGEMAHLGTGSRPLIHTAIYKAFLFCLLVFAVHYTEEFAKRLIHGGAPGSVLHEIRYQELIGRSLILICTFIPLFAFREVRRALGDEKYHALLFKASTGDPGGA
jgi:hypothetical protein